MRQRRPEKDDCHTWRQNHDNRKRSERFVISDDPVFFGRLEYGIEAVVFNQPLTLAA